MRRVAVLFLVIAAACKSKGSSHAAVARDAAAAPAPPAVVELIAGGDDTCARTRDGAWWCWGEDQYGNLAPGVTPEVCGTARMPSHCLTRPTRLGVDADVLALDGSRTCALGVDHGVRCWGADFTGGLGRGDATLDHCSYDALVGDVGSVDLDTGAMSLDAAALKLTTIDIPCGRQPASLAGEVDASLLALGERFGCVAVVDGVMCWGEDYGGMLGNLGDGPDRCGDTPCARAPQRLAGIGAITALAGNDETAAAIRADGRVVTWGVTGGSIGRDGDSTPAPLTQIAHATALALGHEFDCALDAGGAVTCWGNQLIAPDKAKDTLPTVVLTGARAIASSPGASHACAIVGGGQVACWGENELGQLGTGDREPRVTPAIVPGLAGVTAIAVGSHHSCALGEDGTVWCWGGADLGQLGGADASATCQLPYIADESKVPCAVAPVRVPTPRS